MSGIISQLTNLARKQLQNNHIAATQNHSECDVKPVDMPPMVSGSIVGIRPYLALA